MISRMVLMTLTWLRYTYELKETPSELNAAAKGDSTGDLLRVYRNTPDYYSIDDVQCEKVTIPACRRLGYNDTRMSRFMYTENIRPHDVTNYLKLFENEYCEREMLFFLCTIFNPICFKNHKGHIFPCRSVCENVKRNCRSVIINKFGTSDSEKWSSVFDCNNLPEYETDVCIKPKSIVTRSFDFNMEEQSRYDPNMIQCDSNCPKQRKLKRYRQFERADYVIDAQFLSRTTTPNGRTKLNFKLFKAFKSGSARLRKFSIISLWSDMPCVCPTIEYDKRYIILGKERKDNGSYSTYKLYDSKTIVVLRTKRNKGLRRIFIKWKRRFLLSTRKYLKSNLRGVNKVKKAKCWDKKFRRPKKCVHNHVETQSGPVSSTISYIMKYVRFNVSQRDKS